MSQKVPSVYIYKTHIHYTVMQITGYMFIHETSFCTGNEVSKIFTSLNIYKVITCNIIDGQYGDNKTFYAFTCKF